jgi:uncharacterized protein YbjT (DUF2867 family)
MSSIKNVAIAGATGYLGPAVVEAIKKAGFTVTVLTRTSSSSAITFEGVKISKIDYGSIDSLVEALKGQDAVVSTLNHLFYEEQTALVDASIKAGVRRFIPSEYGVDVSLPTVRNTPYLRAKGLIQDILIASNMTYSFLYTGPFFEWGLDFFFVDLKTATAKVLNGGDISVGISTLADISLAIANILLHPKETENKELYMASVMATHNEILSAVREARADIKLSIINQDTKSVVSAALEAEKEGRSMEFDVVRDALSYNIFELEVEAGVPFTKDNALLGINMMTPEDLRQAVINYLKK